MEAQVSEWELKLSKKEVEALRLLLEYMLPKSSEEMAMEPEHRKLLLDIHFKLEQKVGGQP